LAFCEFVLHFTQNPSMIRKRILFVLDSLEGGGAQRVTLNILRFMDKRDFEPILVVVNRDGDYVDILPENVVVHDLRARRARFALFKLTRVIDKIRPAVLYSTTPYIDGITCIAADISGREVKIVLRSPNYVSVMLRQIPFYTRLVARYSYRRADMIITTTRMMSHDLQDKFGIPAHKLRLIYNPLDLESIRTQSKYAVEHPWFHNKSGVKKPIIISMGRLVKQKGFSDLIRAFAIVKRRLPARLVILGQGKKVGQLQELAQSIGVARDVLFCGFQPNPYKYLANSSVFVLSSYWEGFPNSLVEAMACGIPVISTDCPSGPVEIIEPGKNGLLVPVKDPGALAEAVLRVLEDGKLSRRLANDAQRRSMDFSIVNIVKKYEHMFKDVSAV